MTHVYTNCYHAFNQQLTLTYWQPNHSTFAEALMFLWNPFQYQHYYRKNQTWIESLNPGQHINSFQWMFQFLGNGCTELSAGLLLTNPCPDLFSLHIHIQWFIYLIRPYTDLLHAQNIKTDAGLTTKTHCFRILVTADCYCWHDCLFL